MNIYGLGLDVVVVVVVSSFLSTFNGCCVVVRVLVVSLVFSVDAGGFTIVVVFSVFFSAGAAGATSVFCSHAPKSAAVARMQSNFFMVVMVYDVGTKFESSQKTLDYLSG
jgi:hypothetical protein